MPHFLRVTQLAHEVVAWMKPQTMGYKYVTIVIEKPIYNKNAKAFELQWRLFQQVLTFAQHMMAPDEIVEVSNTTVKKALTGSGSAKKIDMVCASLFDGPDYTKEDAEALADAQGVAMCWQLSMGYGPNDKTEACHPGPVIQGGM
jgi:Holliday junction resolvasome RuvABC endonuclease subunit